MRGLFLFHVYSSIENDLDLTSEHMILLVDKTFVGELSRESLHCDLEQS